MSIRYIMALATILGITLGHLSAPHAEAGTRKNFSRYYSAPPTVSAKEDSYLPTRKKHKAAQGAGIKKPIAKTTARQEAEAQQLAAEAARKQQVKEQRKTQRAALVLAKQRQAKEAEGERLAAETAKKRQSTGSLPAAGARDREQTTDSVVERTGKNPTPAIVDQEREQPSGSTTASTSNSAATRKVASVDNESETDELGSAKPSSQSSPKAAPKIGRSDDKSNSCNKAKSIISKYAFADIEVKSCKGEIYHFSATRDAKEFSIKISTLTWELIEVTKVLSPAPKSE